MPTASRAACFTARSLCLIRFTNVRMKNLKESTSLFLYAEYLKDLVHVARQSKSLLDRFKVSCNGFGWTMNNFPIDSATIFLICSF